MTLGNALCQTAMSLVADKCCFCSSNSPPFKVGQLTANFLSTSMRASGAIGAEAAVQSFTVQSLGAVGLMSDIYRLTLTYSGVTSHTAPSTVIAKFGSPNFGERFVSAWLGLYRNECSFYNNLQKKFYKTLTDDLTPRCFYAEVNRSGTKCVLLMQDLAPRQSCNQLDGCTLEQAKTAVRSIAKFHAALYNHHDLTRSGEGHNQIAFVQHYDSPVFKVFIRFAVFFLFIFDH